mmetsp:Transcript_34986/g.79061  ORF Transcript_34986/g.79061 Transcript_34986/m.79061 type:complete len:498 (+) Transcript_34986:240-1733(+)
MEGLPDNGIASPAGKGITDRACKFSGHAFKELKDEGPVGCNIACADELKAGRKCYGIEHDSNGGGEGTCKIFSEPIIGTEWKTGVTCSTLGKGGSVPKVSECHSGGEGGSSHKEYPHELMTKSWKCKHATLKTTCLSRDTYDKITDKVTQTLDSLSHTCHEDDCEQADWAGCVLRMAGHDFMDYDPSKRKGGSDACTDMSHGDNNGLKACLVTGEHGKSLENIYEDFCKTVSLADFLVISAEAVMTASRKRVLDKNRGAPKIDFKSQFKFGRETAKTCDGAADRLPNPENGCDAVKTTFVNAMGLSWRGAAALMGVHTLGRARPKNSGYDGWWSDTENSRLFNNNYYVSMVKKGWRPFKAVCGNHHKNQWYKSGAGGVPQGEINEMMLDTDLCLAFSSGTSESPGPPVKASRDTCCAWLIRHPITKEEFGTFTEVCGLHDIGDCGSITEMKGFGAAGADVLEFADNEKAWLDEFSKAWAKATENGFSGLQSLRRHCR